MWCFYVQANVHIGIEHKLMICIHAMFQHQNWKVLNTFLELIPMNISLMYWIKFKRNSSWEILQLQSFHRALETIFWNRDFAGLKCIFSLLNDHLLIQTSYFVVISQFYFSMLTKLIINIYLCPRSFSKSFKIEFGRLSYFSVANSNLIQFNWIDQESILFTWLIRVSR